MRLTPELAGDLQGKCHAWCHTNFCTMPTSFPDGRERMTVLLRPFAPGLPMSSFFPRLHSISNLGAITGPNGPSKKAKSHTIISTGHTKTILGQSSAEEVYPREEGWVVVNIADYLEIPSAAGTALTRIPSHWERGVPDEIGAGVRDLLSQLPSH